ncbi:MAG: type II toxin-antitoxin system VapC family toxin, partial [Thermofilum sp.]
TKDSYKAKKLLEEDFIVIFHDNDILRNAAEMWKKLRSQGKLVDDRDLLIAATSISRDLPLLTGNFKHFERLKEFGLKFYGNIAK